VRGPLGVADQQHELVAAEASGAVTGAQHAVDPACDRPEQLVAGVVAEAVVDVLEVVEVEHVHRRPARIVGARRRRELGR
jgi:hypothetical protein